MNIENSVVVLTGASSGIGLATARHLSGLGARLILVARDADALDALGRELPGSHAIRADVTDPSDAARLVEETAAHRGRIDVLINNAGRAMARAVEDVDLAEYRDLIELNVVAPLRLMQLVIPRMRAMGGGRIVNISSQASTKHIPRIAGYASTKSALDTLSLTARAELANDGIIVSLVKPGIVDTGFGRNTPSPEPAALRHDPQGQPAAPRHRTREAVARGIAEILATGAAELEILGA